MYVERAKIQAYVRRQFIYSKYHIYENVEIDTFCCSHLKYCKLYLNDTRVRLCVQYTRAIECSYEFRFYVGHLKRSQKCDGFMKPGEDMRRTSSVRSISQNCLSLFL